MHAEKQTNMHIGTCRPVTLNMSCIQHVAQESLGILILFSTLLCKFNYLSFHLPSDIGIRTLKNIWINLKVKVTDFHPFSKYS